MRRLSLSLDLLPQFFGEGRHHYEVIRDALPPDAVIVDARFDGFRDRLDLLIASESFSPDAEGCPVDEIRPLFRTYHAESAATAPAAT